MQQTVRSEHLQVWSELLLTQDKCSRTFVFQGRSLWIPAVFQHLPSPTAWRAAGRAHVLYSGPAQCLTRLQVLEKTQPHSLSNYHTTKSFEAWPLCPFLFVCLCCSGAHVVINGDTDLGYVEDGTACGTDHICFNHKCLPIQQFNFSTCPGTTDKAICSGHGVK